MKKLIARAFAGVVVGLLHFPAASAADYNMVLSMQVSDPNSPIYQAFEFIETEINKRSDNRIAAKLYGGGALGGDREVAESIALGDVQLTTMSTSPLVPFVKELAVFDIPYVFPQDDEQQKKVLLKSDFSESLRDYMEPAGFRLAGFFNAGFRQLTTSKVPVRSADDLAKAKLRIRVQENPYHIKMWNLLGAAPTPMAYTELYGGLQQGVVDGQENPYLNILSGKFYEVQDYMTETNHILLANLILMDKAWYDALPDDLKAVVDGVLDDAVQNQWAAQKAALSDQRAELAKHLEIIELAPEQVDKFKELTSPMVTEIRAAVGDNLVDSLLAAIKESAPN
ncbi:TRAP transporter substrate-binding protein [Brucella gallinifaecis]|uniref:TRAP transporter substrate-binding protein n=1 Tax=Brucella gallinifaecis TaxID=215590 RepID=A0A502BV56_9HYPH|nr:TRAP transporter substrate-binding protein [Brucella gallinifaecis]TPF77116.1 TRAP transporter substrate-binding protein [Brucella gallinifaecis]